MIKLFIIIDKKNGVIKLFDEYDYIVSENLKKALQEKRIQQKELRLLCHKAPATVSRWVDGTAPIPTKYIIPICQLLDISPNEIFGYKSNLSAEEKSLLTAYRTSKECKTIFKNVTNLYLKK